MLLHITNGESVIHSFRQVQLEGDYLSWADLLYEGPVPQPTLDELSPTRARFIADMGWQGFEEALARLSRRDETLRSFRRYDEVVLWFEHDLTDQLQLIQILDWFEGRALGATHLSLINVDGYPGVVPFHGLGQLTGKQLVELLPTRKPVSAQQLSIGRDAWRAFCCPEPSALLNLLNRDVSALSFLGRALRRLYRNIHPYTTGFRGQNNRSCCQQQPANKGGRTFIWLRRRQRTPDSWATGPFGRVWTGWRWVPLQPWMCLALQHT